MTSSLALVHVLRFSLLGIIGFVLACSEESSSTTIEGSTNKDQAIEFNGVSNPNKQTQPQASTTPLAAPDFKLPPLGQSSSPISLSAYRGQVIYLDFWASWCKPCRQQLPALAQLQQSLQADNPFEIIAISLDDQKESAQQFIADLKLTYPIAIDTSGKVGTDYQLVGMPSGFLINQQGFIVEAYQGYNQQKLDQLRLDLLTLMSD